MRNNLWLGHMAKKKRSSMRGAMAPARPHRAKSWRVPASPWLH